MSHMGLSLSCCLP